LRRHRSVFVAVERLAFVVFFGGLFAMGGYFPGVLAVVVAALTAGYLSRRRWELAVR
jgi:hypothetical protein